MLKSSPYVTTMTKLLCHLVIKAVSLSFPPAETSRSLITRDEEKYGVGSMCIYIDDKSTKESIKFAKALASENSIHHILVKYLDTNQIFRGDF